MPDSPTSQPESDFVCDCKEWMRPACAGEPFYREHEGKRYCVLHLPSKEKGADFKAALQRKLDKKDFDFRGTWFPDEMSFAGISFTAVAAFGYATFSAAADFSNTTFSAAAHFSNATFSAEADFSEATFTAEAIFTFATFSGAANFRSAIFSGDFIFRGATFTAEAIFTFATFSASANFRSATFSASAIFESVTFSAAATFRSATFSGHYAYFRGATFTAVAFFDSATFNALADFRSATFNALADFRAATFNSLADFSSANFAAKAYFFSATFSAAAIFSRATFEDANFTYAIFSDAASFNEAIFANYIEFGGNQERQPFGKSSSFNLQFATIEKPDRVSFHTLTLHPHWFINIDSRKFDFTNVHWNNSGEAKPEIEILKSKRIASPHRLLAIASQRLAANSEDNSRYRSASHFRRMALDAERLETWHGFDLRRLNWWYWLASGYGERPFQALMVLVAILLLFGALYTQVGFARWEPRLASEAEVATAKKDEVGAPLRFSRALSYSAGVMTLQRPEPKPATTAAQALVLFETILGPVQAALLALAIRRKFMR